MKYSTKRDLLDLTSGTLAITAFVTVNLWPLVIAFVIFVVTTNFYPIDWHRVKAENQGMTSFVENRAGSKPDPVEREDVIRTVEGELV